MKTIVFTLFLFALIPAISVFAASPGQAVYKKACAMCHDSGVAGAPKLGDKEVWAPLIAGGMNGLYESAINGKGTMPARGGHKSLTDDEVKDAVDYLVEESK